MPGDGKEFDPFMAFSYAVLVGFPTVLAWLAVGPEWGIQVATLAAVLQLLLGECYV